MKKNKIYEESITLSKKYQERNIYGFNSIEVDRVLSLGKTDLSDLCSLLTASTPLDSCYVLNGFKKIFESDPTGVADIKTGCFLRTTEFAFSFRKERIETEVIDSCFVCGLDTIQALQFSGIALIFEDLVSLKQALFISRYYIGNAFLQGYDKELEAEYKILVAALEAKNNHQSVVTAVKDELANQGRSQEAGDYINQQFETIWKLAIKHFKKESGDYFGIPEAALFPTYLIGIAKELLAEGALVLNGVHAWELLVQAAIQPGLDAFTTEARFIKAKELVIAQYGVLAD